MNNMILGISTGMSVAITEVIGDVLESSNYC